MTPLIRTFARIFARTLALTLAIGAFGLASAASTAEATPAAFAFTPEATAKQSVSSSHRFYVQIKGDGWYVGEPVYMTSGVPIVGSGVPAYTCSMTAGAYDKGTRTADVIDEYGNTLMTLSGKSIDKDMRALLAHPDSLIPDMRKQAASVVTKAGTVAKKDPKKAKSLLASVATLKGWKEGDDARALLKDIDG